MFLAKRAIDEIQKIKISNGELILSININEFRECLHRSSGISLIVNTHEAIKNINMEDDQKEVKIKGVSIGRIIISIYLMIRF